MKTQKRAKRSTRTSKKPKIEDYKVVVHEVTELTYTVAASSVKEAKKIWEKNGSFNLPDPREELLGSTFQFVIKPDGDVIISEDE